jgi:DNA-directed RNA polymerase subunit beta
MLTIKSDDVSGRAKTYEAIVKGEDVLQPGVPESFKVLVKELQGLGLAVEVINEEEKAATEIEDEVAAEEIEAVNVEDVEAVKEEPMPAIDEETVADATENEGGNADDEEEIAEPALSNELEEREETPLDLGEEEED